jgi:hypothetical protein
MESTYYNLSAPASYGGLSKFKPKGYTKKEVREWLESQDTYTLHKPIRRRFPRNCIETRPPVYLIKDDHGEILEGTFYSEELQKVIKKDDIYKIEMILKKRKMGRRMQYLVKWLGYPDTFNRWIFKQDLQKKVTLPK